MRNADCGLRIDKTFDLDFESAVELTHKSAFRIPHSAFRNEKDATTTLQPARPRPDAKGIQPDQARPETGVLFDPAADAAVVALRLRFEREGDEPAARRH